MTHRADKGKQNRAAIRVRAVVGHDPNAVYVQVNTGAGMLRLMFHDTEQLLSFTASLMDEATKVWPSDPWVKEYLGQ